MWLIDHTSDNLILNQRCSQKYNNNANCVDNNEIITQEIELKIPSQLLLRSLHLARYFVRGSQMVILMHTNLYSFIGCVLARSITFRTD